MEAQGTFWTENSRKGSQAYQSVPLSSTNLHSIHLRVPLNCSTRALVWRWQTDVHSGYTSTNCHMAQRVLLMNVAPWLVTTFSSATISVHMFQRGINSV